MKFKIGDKVRVVNKQCESRRNINVGDVGTIIEIKEDYFCAIYNEKWDGHQADNQDNLHNWWFFDDDLELVEKEQQNEVMFQFAVSLLKKTIIIKVNEKIYKAQCLPEDNFNLFDGFAICLLKWKPELFEDDGSKFIKNYDNRVYSHYVINKVLGEYAVKKLEKLANRSKTNELIDWRVK